MKIRYAAALLGAALIAAPPVATAAPQATPVAEFSRGAGGSGDFRYQSRGSHGSDAVRGS